VVTLAPAYDLVLDCAEVSWGELYVVGFEDLFDMGTG
jgi:hypothetical protein